MYQNRIQALVGWWLTRSFGFGIDTDRYLLVDLTAEIRRMFLVGSNLLVFSTHYFINIFFAPRFRALHGHEKFTELSYYCGYFDVDISRRVVPHRGRIFIGKKYL